MILHYLNHSRAQRIVWLLEELNLEYTLKSYQRDSKTNLAPADFKQVHPLGRSPVLETEDGMIAESGTIVEYLLDKYGDLLPQLEGADKLQHSYWMHFSEGSLMPPMVANLVLGKAKEKATGLFVKPIANKIVDGIINAYFGPNLTLSLQYVEQHLTGREWFVGEQWSGADIMMSFPLESLVATGRAAKLPAICAFVKRVHAREAYQRGLVKSGEYAYASK